MSYKNDVVPDEAGLDTKLVSLTQKIRDERREEQQAQMDEMRHEIKNQIQAADELIMETIKKMETVLVRLDKRSNEWADTIMKISYPIELKVYILT